MKHSYRMLRCALVAGVLFAGYSGFGQTTKPSTGSGTTVLLLNLKEGNDLPKDAANKASSVDMVGASWSDEGRNGKCLKFSGDKGASYVLVECPALAVKGPAITVEAWIRQTDRTAYNNEQFLVAQGNMQGYQLLLKDGCAQFFIATEKGFRGVEASAKTRVPMGVWAHVAGIYDGNTVKVYINGNERDSIDCKGGNISAVGKCFLGARGDLVEHKEWGSPSCFRGFMDQVRISTSAMTQSELAREVAESKPASN